MSEDTALLERFLAGDQEAFNALMRAHEDRVFAIALRMMRNRDAALDATQETFLTLYRKADRFHHQSAFSTWLYRVTINTCYDQLRKQKRRRADPLPETNDPPDAHSADELSGPNCGPISPRRCLPCRKTSGPRSCCPTSRGIRSRRWPRFSRFPLGP